MINKKNITKSSKHLIDMVKLDKDRVIIDYNIFDDWVKRRKKMFLKMSDIEKFGHNIAREFLLVKEAGYEEKFFAERKKRIKKEFYDDVRETSIDVIKEYYIEQRKSDNVREKALVLKEWVDGFEADVKKILKILSKSKERDFKKILKDYLVNGEIDEKKLEKIIERKYSIKDFLFGYKKILEAKLYVNKFIAKYKGDFSYKKAVDLAKVYYGQDVGFILFSRIETVINLDFETSEIWGTKFVYQIKKIDEKMKQIKDDIIKKEKYVKKIGVDFENTSLFDEERKMIESYVKKISE